MITRMGTVGLLLLFGVGVAAPGYAVAEPGAKLYELTENMSIKGKKNAFRRATSELGGFAKVGTPLCPQAIVDAYNPGATFCFVNATGHDNISMTTGLGTFNGTFTIVVQGDNAVDSPEFVVAKGKFLGDMDFSPAILHTIPFGTVTGKLWLKPSPLVADEDEWPGPGVAFTGVFRLPFVMPADPKADLTACLAGPDPASCLTPPLYLKDDGNVELVRDAERALGYPTVRFEISF